MHSCDYIYIENYSLGIIIISTLKKFQILVPPLLIPDLVF